VSGIIALHGGGEFLPGDERFLGALLEAAATGRGTPDGERPIRIAVVPTAAAAHRPELSGAHGVSAFERVAAAAGRPVAARAVLIVDTRSAADPTLAAELAAADLVYLPGGDPGVIPRVFPGTAALEAIASARDAGAVVAGASAGAMALGPLTWTPDGVAKGLGFIPDVAVMPHADAATWASALQRYGALLPAGMGLLGLAERTGVLIHDALPWRVVGEGTVRWLAPGANEPMLATDGETIVPSAVRG
jgi:cyanophycinase